MKSVIARRLTFALIASFVIIAPVRATSPVWVVNDGDQHIFLAGTLGFLSLHDDPLPRQIETAFSLSDVLVLETDIEEMSKSSYARILIDELTYEKGHTLRHLLNPETINNFEGFLVRVGRNTFRLTKQIRIPRAYIAIVSISIRPWPA